MRQFDLVVFWLPICTIAFGDSSTSDSAGGRKGDACDAPFGHHEGFAVRLCGTLLADCIAPVHATFGSVQLHWQHCNGSTFTAAYQDDSGSGLQGDAAAHGDPDLNLFPAVSKLATDAVQVSAGNGYTLVLHRDGKVSAFGRDEHGRMGVGVQHTDVFKFGIKVNLPAIAKARVVAAGKDHSLFVATDGSAYASGRNEHGQLCHHKGLSHSILPMRVPLPIGTVVVDVAIGDEHSLFLTNEGKVYACGNNRAGQLGIKNMTDGPIAGGCSSARRRRSNAAEDHGSPKLVQLDDVMAIAAGKEHSLFLSRNGKAFAAGDNADGQLGAGAWVAASGPPVEVPLSHVVAVSAAADNSAFLLNDGSVYGAGNQENFPAGLNNEEDCICDPVRSRIDDVVAVQVTKYGGIFLTRDGGTYYSGIQEYNNLLAGGLPEALAQQQAPFPVRVWGSDWYRKPDDWSQQTFGQISSEDFRKLTREYPANAHLRFGGAGRASWLLAWCAMVVAAAAVHLAIFGVRTLRSRQRLLATVREEQELPLADVDIED